MNPASHKTNLLIVAAGLGIGGAEVVIQHLAQAIDRNRFSLTICCIRSLGPIGEKLVADGVDVVVLADPNKPKHGLTAFLKLLRIIRTKRIDIVHTHTTDALFDAALCRLLHRHVRLLHTFHFGNYPHRGGSHIFLERVGARLADRLVAVGDVQRSQIIATYGFEPKDVLRVWNGVALAAIDSAEQFRRQVGAVDHVVIGVTATMIEQKGLFDFLDVASRFRDRADQVRFVIVGDGRLRPRLEHRRRELRLEETVVFTGWMLHANVLALPAFDIFFQPSLWEAMSIALLEAMACAKPVVTTRVGETPHIIEDGVDGLLVDPGDVEEMAMRIQRLVDEPAYRKRLGNAAQAKVRRQFTIERMASAYEEIYAGVLHGRLSKR